MKRQRQLGGANQGTGKADDMSEKPHHQMPSHHAGVANAVGSSIDPEQGAVRAEILAIACALARLAAREDAAQERSGEEERRL
jgi:hypothetical protein